MVNSNQSSTVWQVEILLHNSWCRTKPAPSIQHSAIGPLLEHPPYALESTSEG